MNIVKYKATLYDMGLDSIKQEHKALNSNNNPYISDEVQLRKRLVEDVMLNKFGQK